MNLTLYNLCIKFLLSINRTSTCLCEKMAKVDAAIVQIGVQPPFEIRELLYLVEIYHIIL